jgi:hypothetical protein
MIRARWLANEIGCRRGVNPWVRLGSIALIPSCRDIHAGIACSRLLARSLQNMHAEYGVENGTR